MKYIYIITLLICIFKISNAQLNGTQKICPGSPFWISNINLVTNDSEMYNEYAKGPDGCWYMKLREFSSYPKGTFIFVTNGHKEYYTYDPKSKSWSNGNACVPNPFKGHW